VAFASKDVHDAADACYAEFARFGGLLSTKAGVRTQVRGEGDPRLVELSMQMAQCRDVYRAKLTAVQELIRDELSRPG
jgi:hypothetical protein